ncbi:MAG: IclR family transcriptional regulator [Lachnospiraceae bacterium]|nr:IclR family transcriptional regulator [Lachnospiraceae bacterium]
MAEETIQSVNRVFSILEVLASEGSKSIAELHMRLGLHKTTLHRMLGTLTELGYVLQNPENGKYYLSYKIIVLANQTLRWNTAARVATPFLQELVEDCRETVHMMQREENRVRYIVKIEPNSANFVMGSYVGMELPMYCTAAGKAMMAGLPEWEVEKIWEENKGTRYTEKTVRSLSELRKQLEEIRRTGVAYDNEEREKGLFCVAVCVPDCQGVPRYGISISAPSARMNVENVGDYERKLKKIQEAVAKALGSCLVRRD